MRLNRVFSLCLVGLLILAAPASAQEFRGRINGTVSDDTGAVLPGVTVTASGPALIQPQVQVTGTDGEYRFLALPPGLYSLSFELPGFQTMLREGIRVVINQTLTVNMQMQVATLQETVTVTGESPVVDTTTTMLGTNFTRELLTEIPNARDVWAAMAQAPGLMMTQYDVGGSRTGNQTGYRAYGFSTQNQTKLEGIDTTEAQTANAGYFDFGSFEEFQVGGAGADATAYAAGAVLAISIKNGGDRFSGNWYSDWLGDATISNNVPAFLQTANQRNNDGYFHRQGLDRGNPVDRQYEINFNVGGPIVKGRAWFFTSWRLNDQYKFSLGSDIIERSKLSNKYTFKGTFQLNQNNQIIGFLNKREKLQDKRNLSPPEVPLSASWYQSSRNYPMKVEWTSVLGSRAFLDVLAGQWYNFFPLRPVRDFGLYDGPWGPGRQDLASQFRFDGGATDSYQDQKRFKPQFYVNLSYFQDGWKGSHDMKFGYDWKRDRRNFFTDQPFNIWYRDRNGFGAGFTTEVDLYNTPTSPINDVVYHSVWFNDSWRFSQRLTINGGLRLERYRDGWPEQQFTPEGHPALANWPVDYRPDERARYMDFVAPRTVEARTVAESTTISPRVGFAYDLTGDNRTVLKAYYGQYRFNSADLLADQENEVGRARRRYQFLPCTAARVTNCDLNGNGFLDSPFELGNFVTTVGGGGFVRIDRDLTRPKANELSTNVEREVFEGFSARASYVYKNIRDMWGEMDAIRTPAYTIPISIPDPGALGSSGGTLQSFDRPAGIGSDRVFTNPGSYLDADYHTVEFAVNRRFRNRWMLLSSVGHVWSKMLHNVSGYGYLGDSAANSALAYRPARRLFGDDGRETSTLWNYKLVGRYVMPLDIGTSVSWKVQSGEQYGRTISFPFPGDGNQTVRVTPVTEFRAPAVSILDFRFDKSFRFGRFGKATAEIDIFNVTNSGVVTAYRTTTVNFNEVTAILDPRVVRFGFRYDF